MKLSSRILASAAVVGALACAPAVAQAGTVTVENIPGDTNEAVLKFVAASGEANRLTVKPTTVISPGVGNVTVIDEGAPSQAGTGCSGGGPAGSTVTCEVHPPKPADSGTCNTHDCLPPPIPGTAWRTRMTIELGDGNDTFDGSGFSGAYTQEWKEEVNGGPGDDTISTGGGNDRIVPGPGNDVVHGNGGADRAIADPTPDGNDVLDLGTDSYNLVDDSARTEPLTLEGGILGAAGEADRLEGLNVVVGGSGDDHFTIAGTEFIKGGVGDDTLIGNEGSNYIYGGDGNDTIRGGGGGDRLYGGEGDDNVEGGAGNDFIEEIGEEEDADIPFGSSSAKVGGNDTLDGGEGDDMILAGPGEDAVEGGPGNDRIYGEAGNDRLEGGAGDDKVAGDQGDDRISGGEGDDRLFAGRAEEFSSHFAGIAVDTGVDSLFCGPGQDIAQANTWDRVASDCETIKRVRALKLGKMIPNGSKGTSLIRFTVQGTGALKVSGKDVRPVTRGHVSAPKLATESSGAFVVNPQGAARKRLRARGQVTVTVRLTWQPIGQGAATETRRVKVVLQKRAAGR